MSIFDKFKFKHENEDSQKPSYIDIPIDMAKVECGVSIDNNVTGYYISKTLVTQELWEKVMGTPSPSCFQSRQRPVENVSWKECNEFCKRLSVLTGLYYRLPTEKEWEYAANGGSLTQRFSYSGSDNLDEVAWHSKLPETKRMTHTVAKKKPNGLGLYDMTGNVWEWCNDPISEWSSDFIVKGGSWNSEWFSRVVKRYNIRSKRSYSMFCRSNEVGFRIVRPFVNPFEGIGSIHLYEQISFPILPSVNIDMFLSPDKTFYWGLFPWEKIKSVDMEKYKFIALRDSLKKPQKIQQYTCDKESGILVAPQLVKEEELVEAVKIFNDYLNPPIKYEPKKVQVIENNSEEPVEKTVYEEVKPDPNVHDALLYFHKLMLRIHQIRIVNAKGAECRAMEKYGIVNYPLVIRKSENTTFFETVAVKKG